MRLESGPHHVQEPEFTGLVPDLETERIELIKTLCNAGTLPSIKIYFVDAEGRLSGLGQESRKPDTANTSKPALGRKKVR